LSRTPAGNLDKLVPRKLIHRQGSEGPFEFLEDLGLEYAAGQDPLNPPVDHLAFNLLDDLAAARLELSLGSVLFLPLAADLLLAQPDGFTFLLGGVRGLGVLFNFAQPLRFAGPSA
jgi:hypothetical protein